MQDNYDSPSIMRSTRDSLCAFSPLVSRPSRFKAIVMQIPPLIKGQCESHGTGREKQWSLGKSWNPKCIRVGAESLVLCIILGES